jgi:nitrous oxidase accessory protein NosD
MSRRQPVVVGLFVGLMVGLVVAVIASHLTAVGYRAAKTAATAASAAATSIVGEPYQGDPAQEARLVQSESERLVYVRTVAAAARWNDAIIEGPYRLRTGPTYTLVLPARPAPYTLADLQQLAPETFVVQPNGAYLLSESIIVLAGATLELAPPEGSMQPQRPGPTLAEPGVELRLESNEESFVSIVTMGGSLSVAGTAEAPVVMTSWNSTLGAYDARTGDGRSYVRVIGGHATLSNATISHLGFWSGNTGGLSLTGTDVSGNFNATENPDASGSQNIAGAQLLPPGAVENPATAPEYSFVSAGIDNVSLIGNAFGLFVTSADGVVVRNSTISQSLVDGLVFHRFVTDSSVTHTVSEDNAVDGFSLARSSAEVAFTRVTAEGNGRNGMTLDGESLATGPSATGTAVEHYGDNIVTNSTFADNARYGVEIRGGDNLVVSSSEITGNESGVVVSEAASDVHITDNEFDDQTRQSVAVRDTVGGAEVTGNVIQGGDTGVYVRNAAAEVADNDIDAVSNHGISLIGDVGDTAVSDNEVAGFGRVPIYTEESIGGTVGENSTRDWRPAMSLQTIVDSVFQPLTLVWLTLGLIVLVTAVIPAGQRRTSIKHPYAERVPLTSYSRGVVSRDSIARPSPSGARAQHGVAKADHE